jgi:hypothetical protein
MYRDDDPYLTELREVCLAFPESAEVAELMEGSYRQVALKRMLKALEERS